MANYVYANDPRKPIPIGVQGENDARTVVFDIHKWIEDYGNGTALLVHQRPGDAEPYPVTTAQKAGTIEWSVQQADIIAGAPGRAQLSYQVGDNIVARSPIYLTIAADEITNTTLADYDPAESWLNAILGAVQEAGDITEDVQAAKNAAAQAAASAEKAEEYSGKPPVITDDIWYIWDADAGKYESTGQPSRGPAGPQGEKGDTGEAAGFGVPVITVDSTTGTPSATVSASGPDTAKVFTFAFSGLKGETGPQGEQGPQGETGKTGPQGTAAGFGEATASVDGSTGTPDVTVSVSGPDTAKVFNFQFSGLKGETGAAAGFGQITATVGTEVGTPSVSVEASGPDTAKNLAFAFTNLKGEPGQSVGSIQRTAGTGAPGTTDTYTMYDDGGGTIGTFTVYNGTDGTGSGDFKADGSVPMTGDLNAGEHKIINVAAPTADGDAANKAYVDSQSVEIVKTTSGSVISVSDSADYRLMGLRLYGKSVQDGTPTPEAPVEIESVGDGGNITTQIRKSNLFDISQNIETPNFSISESGNTFTVNALNNVNGNNIFIRVPIDVPVGTTVSISSQSSDGIAFRLQNRYTNGDLAYGELSAYTLARKKGLRLFATCNPFGSESVSVVTGQTATYTNVVVNIGSTALPWEPYESQTLTYPTPNGLPGIPVDSGGNYTDAEGQQWVCDEVDFGRGKYVQRVKKEELTGTPNFRIPDNTDLRGFIWGTCLTNIYKDGSNLSLSNFASFQYWSTGTSDHPIFAVSEKSVYFKPTASTTAEEVNALFTQMIASENPPYIVGQLETPVETDLTPEQITAYAALTTYNPNTTITTDSDPAAGIEVKYLTDSGVSEVLDYYASKADLDSKQDKLSGTAGQFVGFGAEGEAEAQEITAADVGAMPTVDGGTTGQYLRKTADGQAWQDGPDLSGYATRAWVGEQGYLTAVPDEYVTSTELTQALGDYVTADTLAGYGYITSSALNGYATQAWVQGQGYLTAVPAEYVTDTELEGKGYATTTEVAETYAPKALKFTGTFTAAGWTSATGGYSQTINVSGLTADDEPIIDLNSTATDADTFDGQLEAFGLVSNFTTGAGTLTAVVLGDSAPTVDIPIHGVVVY